MGSGGVGLSQIYWVLVYITMLPDGSPLAEYVSRHQTMSRCFDAREQLLLANNIPRPYFPKGVQAVCVQTEIAWEHLKK